MRLLSFFPVILLCVMLLAAPCDAADYTGEMKFEQADLRISHQAGLDFIVLKDGGHIQVPGFPDLPYKEFNVALPTGARVLDVQVLSADFEKVPGVFDIAPCTLPRRMSCPPAANPFIKDQSVYGKDTFYPSNLVGEHHPWDLAGQEFVTVQVHPVRYNPVTGTLEMARTMTCRVVYDVDPTAVRETYNFSDRVRVKTLSRLRAMAVNPWDVTLPAWTGKGSRALDPGDYEHVIITNTTIESELFILSDFYTKCGIPSKVVTVSWITSNYSGSDTPEKMQNFVIDAHSTWGTIYFLVGGDSAIVPFDTYYSSGDNIPNDTYLADYDGDWKCEVYVGRAPVGTETQAEDFVTKITEYMTDPPSGFGEEVFQMGFDLDSRTDGEDLMIDIHNSYVPAWASHDREYDSESGAHKADVINYINSGHNVINHADHCNVTIIGVGTHNHGDTLTTGDCAAFVNGGRVGLMYSIGCDPAAFDQGTAWGEKFVQNMNGGGFAFVGNTRYGWYSSGSTSTYSNKYDRRFFERLWDYNDYHAGETLAESKNAYFPNNGTYKYCFMELTLLGDPAVPIWMGVPGAFTATYDTSIDPGSQTYQVNVKQGGSNYSGAMVCLFKDGQIYERGTTNAQGNVSLVINPTDGGTMYVTVTDYNMKPLMGSCTVTGGTAPPLEVDLILLNGQTYNRGDWLAYDVEVTNSTGYPQSTWMWTNVTLPNSAVYPGSGFLVGPIELDISSHGSVTWNFAVPIPGVAPIGSYTFNAYIGPVPGIDDEDHEPFSIVP